MQVGRSLLVPAALLLLSSPSAAQNLVTNPNFDTDDMTLWNVPVIGDTTIDWDPSDAFGVPPLGSARVVNMAPGADLRGAYTNAFSNSVTAGALYDFGATIRISPDQSATGQAYVDAYWCADVECTNGWISSTSTPAVSADGTWTLSMLTSQVAPAGAISVRVFLQVDKADEGGQLEIYVDRVFFGPEGTTPVSLVSLGVE